MENRTSSYGSERDARIVFDKSDYEDVKAMLPENSCFFCRKLGHMLRDSKEFIACGTRKTEKFANWNKKNPIRK